MVMSAGLVKSETAAACENFQQKKKKDKIPMYKSAITTFTLVLYNTRFSI